MLAHTGLNQTGVTQLKRIDHCHVLLQIGRVALVAGKFLCTGEQGQVVIVFHIPPQDFVVAAVIEHLVELGIELDDLFKVLPIVRLHGLLHILFEQRKVGVGQQADAPPGRIRFQQHAALVNL